MNLWQVYSMFIVITSLCQTVEPIYYDSCCFPEIRIYNVEHEFVDETEFLYTNIFYSMTLIHFIKYIAHSQRLAIRLG